MWLDGFIANLLPVQHRVYAVRRAETCKIFVSKEPLPGCVLRRGNLLAGAISPWRDIRVASEEILRVIFVFDAGQSGEVHRVNCGGAASRLVGLKVRVDPF